MAKSWKTLIKTTDSGSQNDIGNESSLNNFQLTLDEIAAQNEELNNLLKERQSLENEMGNLLQTSNPVPEDPRFAGSIESFKDKREKEKNRTAQKKKLEERILQKSKELEKWEQNQDRLREKLALQKKLLQKKETDQDPSTSQRAPKSTEKSSEKNRFKTDFIRKKKDVIEKKKKVLTEQVKSVAQIPSQKKEPKTTPDTFGLKDLEKFQKKLDRGQKKVEIPTRIRRIKDDWDEKRENQKERLKEKLKDKIELQKLSEKLEEARRFAKVSNPDKKNLDEFPEPKIPEINEVVKTLEKELALDERQTKTSENASAKKAEQKEAERKEEERREKQKEELLSRKKAERKKEEQSNRMKERKNEKYT